MPTQSSNGRLLIRSLKSLKDLSSQCRPTLPGERIRSIQIEESLHPKKKDLKGNNGKISDTRIRKKREQERERRREGGTGGLSARGS